MTESPFCLREGHGEPLVLLHGVGARAAMWAPMIRRIRNAREVIAVDLPGFGGRPLGDVEPTVVGYANEIAQHIESWGVRSPHVAGQSLGGAVALELGRRGLARSVVAFAPIGFWGAGSQLWITEILRLMRTLSPPARRILPALLRSRAGRGALFSLFYGRPGAVPPDVLVADSEAFIASEALRPALDAFLGHVFTDPGRLNDLPVTVVWGRRDGLLTAGEVRTSRIALPRARHVVLRGCGHVPFYDDPVACAMLLLGDWHDPSPMQSSHIVPAPPRRTDIRRVS